MKLFYSGFGHSKTTQNLKISKKRRSGRNSGSTEKNRLAGKVGFAHKLMDSIK
jgi:hypothetical protein